jgi:hypothetical protein
MATPDMAHRKATTHISIAIKDLLFCDHGLIF